MLTKTQKKKRETIKKRVFLVLKILFILGLAVIGFVYLKNNTTGEENAEVFLTETTPVPKTSKEVQKDPEPVISSVPTATEAPTGIDVYDNRININTADVNELTRLKGIGKKRAMDIIEYRNEHGNFVSIEDIMKVKGIKLGIFSKIKDDIFCG